MPKTMSSGRLVELRVRIHPIHMALMAETSRREGISLSTVVRDIVNRHYGIASPPQDKVRRPYNRPLPPLLPTDPSPHTAAYDPSEEEEEQPTSERATPPPALLTRPPLTSSTKLMARRSLTPRPKPTPSPPAPPAPKRGRGRPPITEGLDIEYGTYTWFVDDTYTLKPVKTVFPYDRVLEVYRWWKKVHVPHPVTKKYPKAHKTYGTISIKTGVSPLHVSELMVAFDSDPYLVKHLEASLQSEQEAS